MKSILLRFLVLPVCITCLLVTVASATDWQVPGDAPTIAAGLALAEAGDTVIVAAGTYYEYDLVMPSGVTLRSETGLAEDVTIDAQQQGRVLLCEATEAGTAVVGITFTGGWLPSPEAGAGLLCTDGEITVSECTFTGNEVEYDGAGLTCTNATADISHCVFEYNVAGDAGAGLMFNRSGGEVDHCLFQYNEALDGPALFTNHESSPTISNCIMRKNDAQFFGGAIFVHVDSYPLIRQCTIVDNFGRAASAIFLAGDAVATLENCVIAFNTDGPAFSGQSNGGLDLECCDVFGHEDGDFDGTIEDQIGINGNIAEDPGFCDIDAGDLGLVIESPCLPANNDCGVLMGAVGDICEPSPVPEIAAVHTRLLQNHPNPFNPITTIGFELADAGHAELAIYTLDGRLVRRLLSAEVGAGRHEYIWHGRDESGYSVPSGVYLYSLETAVGRQSKRLTLVR